MVDFNFGARNIGIDLGTNKISVTVTGKGIVLSEPFIVAINKLSKEILAVGNEAINYESETPEIVKIIKPMKDGAIADYEIVSKVLKNIIKKVCQDNNIRKPKIVVAIPVGISELEEKILSGVIFQSGAREVYLVDAPICAAVGAGLKINEPNGKMIVDIGGGITEVAVISMNKIMTKDVIKVAGNVMNEDIVEYLKETEKVMVSLSNAELLKMEIGSAESLISEKYEEIQGRDISTGLSKNIFITSKQIEQAIKPSINEIIEVIKNTLVNTSAELCIDVYKNGIYLTGGGANIKNIDNAIAHKLNIKTYISKRSKDGVIIGLQRILENQERYKEFISKHV